MKKKIIIVLLSFIIVSLTVSLFVFLPIESGSVKLVSIGSATSTNTVSYYNTNNSVDNVALKNRKNDNNDADVEQKNQYMIIKEQEQYFTLKITLDNPKNFYIFDFSLKSSDPNFMVKVNNNYELLTDLPSIRWNSDTNYICYLDCYSSESEYKTTVEMKSLYYSDRTDGKNKYDGDIKENNLINIYRKNDGVELVEQSLFKFKVNVIHDNVDKNSLYFNDVKVNDGDVLTLSLGDNLFKFNYIYDNQTVESSYNKKLEDLYILRGCGSWPGEMAFYYLAFDFDKAELYQYGNYVKDAEKQNLSSETHKQWDARFQVSNPFIPGNEYILVYKDDIIIKISYTSNRTCIIEVIQGL
ncbi:MAG: hypothetical protein E7341_02965 [Clostridiales bacterium]|nr:hypothetical protein [Clostridiales bacterium]